MHAATGFRGRIVGKKFTPKVRRSTISNNYSATDRGEEYCVERVCLCVCLSVRDHLFGTTRSIFTNFYACYLAVSRSSSGGVVICYVFPLLWMTSCLHISWGCSTSPPGWGSEAHTQRELGAHEYPLQAADSRDYFLQTGRIDIFETMFAHNTPAYTA